MSDAIHAAETKRIFEREFARAKDEPVEWAFSARTLRRAAELLFEAESEGYFPPDCPKKPENEGLGKPATLLFGLAMENMIKACLIKQHKFDVAFKKFEKAFKQHRLDRLAKETGFPISKPQLLVLVTLSAFVRWAGKYPVSIREDEFTIPNQHLSGANLTPNELSSESIDIIDPLYRKLEDVALAELRSARKLVRAGS